MRSRLSRLQWLHVASTAMLTAYHLHGRTAVMIGSVEPLASCPATKALLCMTTGPPDLQFSDCQHAFCNVHHLRELRFVFEQYGQAWAEKMARLLCAIKAESNPPQKRTLCYPQTVWPPTRPKYDSSHCPRLGRQPAAQADPTQSTRPTQTITAHGTCSTVCTSINLASWPLCMISASLL